MRTIRVGSIRAVCIDLDGTLLDTIPDLAAAANGMLNDLSLSPLPEERIRQFVGKGAEVLIQRTLAAARESASSPGAALEAPSDTPEDARTYFFENYRRLNGSRAALYPGVATGLRRLRDQGLKLACVTNKPEEFVGPLLERFGIESFFDFLIGGDTLPFKKPHPGQLLEACRRWMLEPGQVLMVGDSINDALAARAAGMPVLLVPYGYNEGHSVQDADADGIVSTLSELSSLFQGKSARES